MADRTINDYTAKGPADTDHCVWQTGNTTAGQWFRSSWLQIYTYISGKLGALAFRNTVGTAQIEADAVDGTKIADNSIGNEHLQDNAVSTAKIANDSVINDKLAHGTAGAIRAYSGAGAPSDIAPGTAGLVLTSNGVGNVPTYQAAAGGGDMTAAVYDPRTISDDVFDMDNMTEGALAKILTQGERDKVGHLTVTQAVNLDQIESDTATNNAKISNATHTGEVTGSGALTITNGAVTLAKLADATQGDIITFGAAGAPAYLPAGTAGQVLKTGGAGANVSWQDETGGEIADGSVTLPKHANQIQGSLLTWSESNLPATVGPGTKGQVLTTQGSGSDFTWENSPHVISGQNFGAANDGDVITQVEGNGLWVAAQANNEANGSGIMGIYDFTDQNVLLITDITTTGLTPGQKVYLDPAVAGGWTTTKPATTGQQVRILGYALSSTVWRFMPDTAYAEVG